MTLPSVLSLHLPAATRLLICGSIALVLGCARDTSRAEAHTGLPDSPPPAYLAFARGRVDIEGGLVTVATSSSGLIKEVHTEEGDDVHAGQILAVIDDRLARASLAISTAALAETKAALLPIEARLSAAKREAARLLPLLPTEAVAQVDAEKANDLVTGLQAEIAVLTCAITMSEARVRADEVEVDNHSILAPADGRIVKRSVRRGETVNTFAPLFLLAPNTPHIVRADLEERFVDKVAPGMVAEVVLDNDNQRVLQARILRIGEIFGAKLPTGEPGERVDLRTVECIVALNNASLRIGQRVLVRIPKP